MARNLPKVLQNGLVMWIDGSVSWTTAYDISWSSFNLTTTNSPTTQRILQNKWFTLNGSNQRIDSASTAFGIGNTWTINYWINPVSSSNFPIWMPGPSNVNTIALFLSSSCLLGYITNTTWANWKQYKWNTTVPTNKWTMGTLTWDGTSMKIYFNWIEDTPYTVTQNDAVTQASGNKTLNIGSQGGSLFYNWKIFNYMMWNRTLSAKEVEMLYYSTFIK